ncbi:MAG: diguanylate cyclase, partial [Acidobacteriota bacterium]|nr:diguanylate cyclase [Acidobacteriota bacterium]
WMMPEMTGLDLIRRVRTAGLPHYVYIILLTSRNDQEDIIRGLDVGADDYITKPYDEKELMLRLRAGQRLLRLQEELAARNQNLRQLAMVDSLTGVRNRRAFDTEHPRIHSEAQRYGHPYSVAMIDLDRFKAYNDTLGHPEGDLALQYVSRLFVKNARTSDVFFRYGGEEFVWLLTHTDAAQARVGAERMRRLVEDAAIPHPTNEPHDVVTVSIGLSSFEPGSKIGVAEILKRSDEALYRAKQEGRNRVRYAEPDELELTG